MLINWPAWYLLGFDHLRGEPRTFRFDRFRNVEIDEHGVFRARPREIATALLGDKCDTRLNPVQGNRSQALLTITGRHAWSRSMHTHPTSLSTRRVA